MAQQNSCDVLDGIALPPSNGEKISDKPKPSNTVKNHALRCKKNGLSQMKGHWGDMTTKCNGGSWIGSQDGKITSEGQLVTFKQGLGLLILNLF